MAVGNNGAELCSTLVYKLVLQAACQRYRQKPVNANALQSVRNKVAEVWNSFQLVPAYSPALV